MPADPDAAPAKDGTPAKHAAHPKPNMNGPDFAKAIGINKPANIRDKIKRWQDNVTPDELAPSPDRDKTPSTPKSQPATPRHKPLDAKPDWVPAHASTKSLDANTELNKDAKKNQPAPVHNELDDDLLTATAPKKRVISDSHWRSKLTPQKDPSARPAPKTIPNAWVRPSRIVKKDRPVPPAIPPPIVVPTRDLPPKTPKTPKTPTDIPQAVSKPASPNKTSRQRQRQRQRRPSRPESTGNDGRPTSSGSGSAPGTKSEGAITAPSSPPLSKDKDKDKEDREIVRIRRRRARTSPRGSLSAEDAPPVRPRPAPKSEPSFGGEDLANLITVEYANSSIITSPREDELRERRRRRRSRGQMGDASIRSKSQGGLSTGDAAAIRSLPSRHNRKSYPKTDEEEVVAALRPRKAAQAPVNPAFASRLEAWLERTPDVFPEAKPRRRHAPKDSISTLELHPPKEDVSILSASTESKDERVEAVRPRSRNEPVEEIRPRSRDEPVEETRPRSSGSGSGSGSGGGSRRRRRRRSREIKIDTTVAAQKPVASEPVIPEPAVEEPAPEPVPEPVPEPPVEEPVEEPAAPEPAPSVASEENTSTAVPGKVSKVPLSPTPTLKRRGAARRNTHSRSKSRSMSSPLRESMSTDDLSKEEEMSVDMDAGSSVRSTSIDASVADFESISLKPRPLTIHRRLASRGKRLSTIASVSSGPSNVSPAPPSDFTISDMTESFYDENRAFSDVTPSVTGSIRNPETSTMISRRSTRRTRLASHADLISVLSMPKTGSKSIVSARSIRTNRSRLATATIGDIMSELTTDETKFMRELRTLVDGVIPVLLSCVVSKTDSAVAAGLFSRAPNADPNEVTKPIIEMGVCLERLKTLHKRVPKQNPESFLSWAQTAQRVYFDYIGAWRLGFQDVVISLASADDDPFHPAKVVNGPDDGAPWDEGMPRNAEGYVVNGEGERVDVAYMLKRPLVRLKYLAKTLRGINHVQPSDRAEQVSVAFQELVTAARKRSNDEHARLEDEAAAMIDATRTRDPRSLAPLAGVRVDRTRCVRARDYFDMYLYHSSGQEISCRVEVLLRDNATGTGPGGDILLCEVDQTGRWLLLPPVQQNRVSARNGDQKGEIIVMIRGNQSDGSEWSEVMSLTIDDEQAGFEWVQMLGLNPVPPQIADIKRGQFNPAKPLRPSSSHGSSSLASAITASTVPYKSRTPSPHEIDIPIGEQHTDVSKVWKYDTPDKHSRSRTVSPITPPDAYNSQASKTRDEDIDRTPRTFDDILGTADNARTADNVSPTGLKRTRAKRLSRTSTASPVSSKPSRQITLDDPIELVSEPEPIQQETKQEVRPRRKSTKRRGKNFSVWMPTMSGIDQSDESDEDDLSAEEDALSPPGSPPQLRSQGHRRVSSTPSLDLPSIPRQRKSSQPTTPLQETAEYAGEVPVPLSAPPRLGKAPETAREEDSSPPPVPPHRSPSPASPVTLKGSKTPNFTPTLNGWKQKRRSSSPLKHEYEPSTCTESSTESTETTETEEDALSDDLSDESDDSITSESSDDELDDDVPAPLMPSSYAGLRAPPPRPRPTIKNDAGAAPAGIEEEIKVSPPASIYNLPNGTITPSQSASNTPYRTVPHDSTQASKAIASIFTWVDAGYWDPLHPSECSVVVTPGKLEVFEITATHSKPFDIDDDEIVQLDGRAPLIAVELTPLVPLRKSTAVDISIRSPPTAESRISTGNNIMLRSRNPNECTQLYAMINQARINNPTYAALQNARGPYGGTSWAEAMDRQNAARTNAESSSGWFGAGLGRKSSYRKTSTRAASVSAATESSVGTMNTAFRSALSRFSFGKNGIFSVRNSTLESRSINSFETGDSGSPPGSGASTPNAAGAPAGITNTKCRLYERESVKKWRDMGSARLTIMLPSPHPTAPASPTNPLQRAPGTRDRTQERRILVTSKNESQTLLDVTLSETCFERVARSGIAVSVWEDLVGADGEIGQVQKTGGVLGARARVFMIQMKSEREAAYCFGLLGKLRY